MEVSYTLVIEPKDDVSAASWMAMHARSGTFDEGMFAEWVQDTLRAASKSGEVAFKVKSVEPGEPAPTKCDRCGFWGEECFC